MISDESLNNTSMPRWGVGGGIAGYPVIPASLRDQLLASVLCIDILFCLSKAEL